MRRRDLLVPPVVGGVGLVVLLIGTFLPWLRSGRNGRNSYQAGGAVRRLIGTSGLVDSLLALWPLVGLACAAVVALLPARAARPGDGARRADRAGRRGGLDRRPGHDRHQLRRGCRYRAGCDAFRSYTRRARGVLARAVCRRRAEESAMTEYPPPPEWSAAAAARTRRRARVDPAGAPSAAGPVREPTAAPRSHPALVAQPPDAPRVDARHPRSRRPSAATAS